MAGKYLIEDLGRIPENISFPQEEEKIQKYWTDNKVFETCLIQSKDKPRYVDLNN